VQFLAVRLWGMVSRVSLVWLRCSFGSGRGTRGRGRTLRACFCRSIFLCEVNAITAS
jgi:hypothetical protein